MTDSYPDDNPKTIYGDKKLPLHLAPMSAVHAMAEAFADGAKKYGPYNWREKRVSSTVYYAAALRHLAAWFDGEEIAEDSGVSHLGHALACLGILVDAKSVGYLNDNRPPRGASASIQRDWVTRKDSLDITRKPTPSWNGEKVNEAIDRYAETERLAEYSGSLASAPTHPQYGQTRVLDRVSSHGLSPAPTDAPLVSGVFHHQV